MQILQTQITWIDVVIGMMAVIAIDTIIIIVIAFWFDYKRRRP